ncbi:hypothetical protein BT96DRAFT_421243 [Gymnopus androsaceus JB14]|uniref:Uncharacterized protein n=1 Tax=Gymnopus androsaceus JB14 TaxID=1447944 RepID=A0A6A4GSS0_9AGAR|nr:hypothetical protein BT96DRAFT_421243 [Gymnopus androsaceus JB14]
MSFKGVLSKQERLEEGITEGLVRIGKTPFAVHYSAAVSLDRCYSCIQELITSKKIKPQNAEMVATFSGTWASMKFQLGLMQYIKIIDPLARCLWSLEASKTNPDHVFLFWLAMGAELKALFDLGEDATGISQSLALPVSLCVQWCSLSNRSGTIPMPAIRIPATATHTDDASEADQTPNPKAYRRVKQALKNSLRVEVECFRLVKEEASIASLLKQMSSEQRQNIKNELTVQLLAYSHREYPFTDPIGDKSILEWWRELLLHPKTQVLAFLLVKFYSVLANSMPDERWGSKKTRANAPLKPGVDFG